MIEVPLVDLAAAHAEVAGEVSTGFDRVLAGTAFIGGTEVAAFEREFAAFCGAAACVGVANGTDALELALRAVGAGPGDEVILPVNTFVATAEAVAATGARPVFVDCDPRTGLIDAAAVAAALTPATTVVVPVHLYGQLAPVEDVRAVVDGRGTTGRGIAIVEDAAQCQGATRHGLPAGVGGVAATSFYPGKNLGAYGDAGAVVTADPALARTVRMLASHGGLARYEHEVVGRNSRMDALQAVVLRAKLTRLAGWNAARRRAAARYDELLAPLEVGRPVTLDGNEHVWHLYVVRVPGDGSPARRDRALAKMQADGIAAGVHYPVPLHRTGAFAHLGYGAGAFPHAEAAAAEILSLPLYPQISPGQQQAVVDALASALATA